MRLYLIFFFVFVSAVPWNDGLAAEVTTTRWKPEQYSAMTSDIMAGHDLNLLTFPGARNEVPQGVSASQMPFLIDGQAGILGGAGRVGIGGHPSRIIYYLGRPQTIKEIALYTGNGDQRANQDFEIRLANNEKNPGIPPRFPDKPTYTSGETILGADAGGFKSRIAETSGQALEGGKRFDWIEFRLWRVYPSKAGEPAKSKSKANNWASYVELQVLGDPDDPNLFESETARKEWLEQRETAKRMKILAETVGDDAVASLKNPESIRRAIEDLTKRYPDRYDGTKHLALFEKAHRRFQAVKEGTELYVEAVKEFAAMRREVLLANPLLDFETLLFRKARNPGLTSNWISNCARPKGGYGNTLETLNPRRPSAETRLIAEAPNDSFIGDICLHWSAEKMLVTALADDKTWQIFELKTDGSGLRQVTPTMGNDIDNAEGCYVPDGSVLFISTANMMGVPCIDGSSPVGNVYRLEDDGRTIRQLTFEQDQDWCPVLLPNGRIMYLRWEYTDTPHYFTRILFTMNPDGTNQVEHYGSGSYWPNSLFYAKPVPDHSTKFVGIVSGHHGVAREGELVVFDPAKGRKEATGVVQRIPGYGKEVEPIIKDQLVDSSWPRFLFPAPLSENYYLVSARLSPEAPWALYLVDVFDNMLKLREEPGFHLLEPTPLIAREEPRIVPSRIEPGSKTATVFITDCYHGEGLKNIPPGTVEKFRVFAYSYGYRGIGGHDVFGLESCWDARRMIGEVPVYEDGSAMFEIPANTPIALQPLDRDGSALQLMRSWLVGMPGENVSCAGCHESQNSVSPPKSSIARMKPPAPMQPFLGPERPFNFENEVQPVLDRYCVGCHDGGNERAHLPNFADTSKGPKSFSNAYHALARYVRRPGPESDVYVFQPMEYHSSTSELFVRLEKGHHGVQIDPDSMRRLYAWTDLNVPYYGTWMEVAEQLRNKGDQTKKYAEKHVELKAMYAGLHLDFEEEAYLGFEKKERPTFIKPSELPEPERNAPNLPGWPFDPETAKQRQGTEARQRITIEGEAFEMVRIPAGKFVKGDPQGFVDEFPRSIVAVDKPFWMATTETTNALYRLFDPAHDSRYIDQWCKDHTLPGYPANRPDQPVIRIAWNEALRFCDWLSAKTGRKFRLPTEAEWEWACRAGSASPMWYGETSDDFGKMENMADDSTKRFVVRGVNPQPVSNPADWEAFIPRAAGVDDGQMYAERLAAYASNPWGLFDMHGSVSEFTSDRSADGRVVVKGGSWRDRPEMARAGFKRYYQPYQKVFNVGIRLVCE